MIKPLPFDELNTFRDVAAEEVETTGQLSVKPKQMADMVFDLLIMAYVFGYDAVNETLGTNVKPQRDRQYEAIFKEIAGKTWEQRVTEYTISGSIEDIKRVVETDMVRIYNQAVLDAANQAQEEAREEKPKEPSAEGGETVPQTPGAVPRPSETVTEEEQIVPSVTNPYVGQPLYKIWGTMLDEKVRDTHAYLEGMKVPLDAEFYTYDGDHAQAPGGFTDANNNCNCRCALDISL